MIPNLMGGKFPLFLSTKRAVTNVGVCCDVVNFIVGPIRAESKVRLVERIVSALAVEVRVATLPVSSTSLDHEPILTATVAAAMLGTAGLS